MGRACGADDPTPGLFLARGIVARFGSYRPQDGLASNASPRVRAWISAMLSVCSHSRAEPESASNIHTSEISTG
jgi:hypothetical protein